MFFIRGGCVSWGCRAVVQTDTEICTQTWFVLCLNSDSHIRRMVLQHVRLLCIFKNGECSKAEVTLKLLSLSLQVTGGCPSRLRGSFLPVHSSHCLLWAAFLLLLFCCAGYGCSSPQCCWLGSCLGAPATSAWTSLSQIHPISFCVSCFPCLFT